MQIFTACSSRIFSRDTRWSRVSSGESNAAAPGGAISSGCSSDDDADTGLDIVVRACLAIEDDPSAGTTVGEIFSETPDGVATLIDDLFCKTAAVGDFPGGGTPDPDVLLAAIDASDGTPLTAALRVAET